MYHSIFEKLKRQQIEANKKAPTEQEQIAF
jgi:hypothetical protein